MAMGGGAGRLVAGCKGERGRRCRGVKGWGGNGGEGCGNVGQGCQMGEARWMWRRGNSGVEVRLELNCSYIWVFFPNQLRDQTPRRIFSRNGLKDAVLGRDVFFGLKENNIQLLNFALMSILAPKINSEISISNR